MSVCDADPDNFLRSKVCSPKWAEKGTPLDASALRMRTLPTQASPDAEGLRAFSFGGGRSDGHAGAGHSSHNSGGSPEEGGCPIEEFARRPYHVALDSLTYASHHLIVSYHVMLYCSILHCISL